VIRCAHPVAHSLPGPKDQSTDLALARLCPNPCAKTNAILCVIAVLVNVASVLHLQDSDPRTTFASPAVQKYIFITPSVTLPR